MLQNKEDIGTLRKLSVAVAATAFALSIALWSAVASAQQSLVDLNSASQQQLEQLKGVGPATAKKIIAARPYASVEELTKAGLSAKTVEGFKGSVTVGATPAAGAATASTPAATKGTTAAKPAAAKATPAKSAAGAASTKLIDLNAASEKDLETIKGVGPATAKKIIAGRPYTSVDGLSTAGLSAKSIASITPYVTVGQTTAAPAAAAPAAKATPAQLPAATTVTPVAKTAIIPPTAPAALPAPKTATPSPKAAKLQPGQVVNLNTASLSELEALPEIGPVKTQAIIDGRPHATIEDVMKVKGIKQKTFDRLKAIVVVR